MFDLLGRWIADRPVRLVMAWALVLAAAAVYSAGVGERPPADVGSFLPPESAHSRAQELSRRAFPLLAHQSYIVLLAVRPAGLTPQDMAWIHDTAVRAGEQTERRVLSPANPFLRHRLLSPDGRAAMVVIGLSGNYISAASIAAVERVEACCREGRPDGLTVEITGPGGIGRDYFNATSRALHNTTWVTVAAVLVILVAVYRSPAGALVPLVSIGASVYLAFVLLGVLERLGWAVSNTERIFAVVLLFGAGVDFAMFWIARYREDLGGGEVTLGTAARTATRKAGPAILASAATTICGLSTMMATDLVPTANAGKVLAPILLVSLVAALTLTPALARLLGRWLFWPARPEQQATLGQRVVWPWLARRVSASPRAILLGGLVVLGLPALQATRLTPRFDSLSQLPPGSSSARGYELAQRHFPRGVLYPATLLVRFDRGPGRSDEGLDERTARLGDRIAAVEGVLDVYSLDRPLGRRHGAGILDGLLARGARDFYVSRTMPVLRLEVLIDHLPFSAEAMATAGEVLAVARECTADWTSDGGPVEVLMSGLTAYIMSVREVVGRDQVRVMLLATLVIAAIVLVLIRDLPLTAFMLLATWLTFGATLTLTDMFFLRVMGESGLDYKVRLIVFVIVVAVGQDYNIFLVTRLLEDPSSGRDRAAAQRAIVTTGSVISNCGLIMAATLGSLWAGGLSLLQQVGFALALGILIDTFFVRSVLLPSFFLAVRRGGPRPDPSWT